MIEIDVLTIECIKSVLTFDYTINGEKYSYKGDTKANEWTIDELKELVSDKL